MSLDGATVVQLLAALRAFQSAVPTGDQEQYVSVGKTRDWEIRIRIIPADEDRQLPSVDIREFIERPGYTGPTKAGVRFTWSKLKQFTQFVEVLAQELGTAVSSESSLFPGFQPQWVHEAQKTIGAPEHKTVPDGFDVKSLKSFPDAFLPDAKFDVETISLPPELLKTGQDRSGNYFVTNESGFSRQVRNEVEGKFLLYAQQRGLTELRLPKEMFKIFSAVTGYEKYCRELRQKLVRDLEKRSGNPMLAEHIAKDTLQAHGIPIC